MYCIKISKTNQENYNQTGIDTKSSRIFFLQATNVDGRSNSV